MLNGPRIRLRPVDSHDVGHVARWLDDSETVPFPYPVTLARAETRVASDSTYSERNVAFTVEALDGTYLGETRLHHIDAANGHAELGLVIADDAHRRKGFGTEAARRLIRYAFAELGLHRITARVRADNPASLAFTRSLGFQFEACFRARFFRRGAYVDCHEFSLACGEWEQTKGAA